MSKRFAEIALSEIALSLSLLSAAGTLTAQPRHRDAENLGEAVGMAIGTVVSSESVRDRCVELFPDLRTGLERSHLVQRVELARLLAVAWTAADPRFEQELDKVAASSKTAVQLTIPDASDQSKSMCVGTANVWIHGGEAFRKNLPKAAAFLDEHEFANPLDTWTDWKIDFIGGCVKQGLNRGMAPGEIEPFCDCGWDRVRSGVTEAEYVAYGEAVDNARLSESPEARKIGGLVMECALASTDKQLMDPTNPLGAVRARIKSEHDEEEVSASKDADASPLTSPAN